MLTEEAIKETRFFRGVDEKVYLVVHVRSVRIATITDISDCKESDLMLEEEDVCRQFVPVQADFSEFIQNQIVINKPVLPKPENRKEPSRSASRKKPAKTINDKTPSTHFKGVKRNKKDYADGRPSYSVQYYNKQTKKNEHLGSFDNVYLAAAAYAERDGNIAEARRLRALVKEHQELNPNRPLDGTTRHEAKLKGGYIYVCKRCGLEYQNRGTCANCGNDDMRKVPA